MGIGHLMTMEERIVLDAVVAVDAPDNAEAEAGNAGEDHGAAEVKEAAPSTTTPVENGTTAEAKVGTTANTLDAENENTSDANMDNRNGSDSQDTLRAILVNKDLQDFNNLVNSVAEDVMVYSYDNDTVDLQEIIDRLKEQAEGQLYDSIAIATEGNGEGSFALTESENVSWDTFGTGAEQDQQEFFEALAGLVNDGGEIDIISCNTAKGEHGTELLEAIAGVTGLDIAGSTDLTGNETLGGDWVLEKSTDSNETDLVCKYFNSDISDYSSVLIDRFAGGSGTSVDPYQIETFAQFMAIESDGGIYLDKHFIITADLDAGEWYEANGGSTSICNFNNPFTGTIDGQDHSVKDIDIGTLGNGVDAAGLIGVNKGSISNIRLIDTDGPLNSEGSGWWDVRIWNNFTGPAGALVGINDVEGSILNCFSDMEVHNNHMDCGTGGLVGLNRGNISKSRVITEGVYTEYGYAGGLVGINEGGDIFNCYSETYGYNAEVATNRGYVGGLVGKNTANIAGTKGGHIQTSYANTTTHNYEDNGVGGLVGINGNVASGELGTNPYNIIEYSYSTGIMRFRDNSGGIAAKNYIDGKIENCYTNAEFKFTDSNHMPSGLSSGAIVGINNEGGIVMHNYSDPEHLKGISNPVGSDKPGLPSTVNDNSSISDLAVYNTALGWSSVHWDNLTDGNNPTLKFDPPATASDNSAPVFDPSVGNSTLDSELASNSDPSGTAVSDIIVDGAITDADGAVEAIVVWGVDNTYGKWQYSTDSGSTWKDFSTTTGEYATLSDTDSSILLDANSKVRFIPSDNTPRTVSFNFLAWDMSFGSAGETADISNKGEIYPFSSAGGTAALTLVDSLNSAPVFNSGAGNSTLTSEMSSNNNPSGTAVSDIIVDGAITDADGAVEAIAVWGVDNTYGKWQYSTNGGSSWSDFTAVTGAYVTLSDTNSSRLLDSSSKIRFIPTDNVARTVSFNFIAWDKSTGSVGGTADTSVKGGTSAFSSAGTTASLELTNEPNSAPVLNDADARLTSQQLGSADPSGTKVSDILVGGSITDSDGAVEALIVTSVDNRHGIWQYSTDNGSSWNNFTDIQNAVVHLDIASGTSDAGKSRLLDGNCKIRFLQKNGDTFLGDVSFTFQAWDKSAGSVGSVADPTVNGGTTAFSSTGDSANLTITAIPNRNPEVVNPIPDQDGADSFDGAGNMSFTFDADVFSDPDGDSLSYSAEHWDVNNSRWAALPAWLSFNSSTRTFSGNPSASDEGSLRIRVTAEDGRNGTQSDEFIINITNANDAPTDLSNGNVSVYESSLEQVVATLTPIDADIGDQHTQFVYTLLNNADKFKIDGNALVILSGVPVGNYSISIKVIDPNGEFVNDTILVTVNNPVNDNPVNDNPVNDNPVNDNPVNDNPVNDNPVDDNPVDDNPVDDNPVDDNLPKPGDPDFIGPIKSGIDSDGNLRKDLLYTDYNENIPDTWPHMDKKSYKEVLLTYELKNTFIEYYDEAINSIDSMNFLSGDVYQLFNTLMPSNKYHNFLLTHWEEYTSWLDNNNLINAYNGQYIVTPQTKAGFLKAYLKDQLIQTKNNIINIDLSKIENFESFSNYETRDHLTDVLQISSSIVSDISDNNIQNLKNIASTLSFIEMGLDISGGLAANGLLLGSVWDEYQNHLNDAITNGNVSSDLNDLIAVSDAALDIMVKNNPYLKQEQLAERLAKIVVKMEQDNLNWKDAADMYGVVLDDTTLSQIEALLPEKIANKAKISGVGGIALKLVAGAVTVSNAWERHQMRMDSLGNNSSKLSGPGIENF